MPATSINTIIANVLGYSLNTIRNVQPSAKAVCSDQEITYKYPVFMDTDIPKVQACIEKLDNAYQDIYEILESINYVEDGEEKNLVVELDNGIEGFFFKFMSELPMIAFELLKKGDLYSTLRKELLLEKYPDLSESDFSSKSEKKAVKKEAKSVEVVSTGGLLD